MMQLQEVNHVHNALSKDARYDGRKKDEFREIIIEKGLIATAEGSAKVQIGDTVVLAGVKLSTEKPYSDSPEDGNLMVNAEFLPIASDDFEAGPPGIDSIELARVIDRSIREGHAMDTSKLCIQSGELVWNVMVDICILNHSGNLFDASSLAVLAALQDAKFPALTEGNVVDYHEHTDVSVPLEHSPLSVTVCKVRDQIFVDPVREEQEVADARLTVGVVEDGNLCALQKGGDSPLSIEDVEAMVDLAKRKTAELRKLL